MERHCSNALKLAGFFENHSSIKKVKYPFIQSHPQYELAKKQMRWGGGIVCCDLAGTKAQCFRFINNLKFLTITANLGDTRTIVTHPSTTTHCKLSEEDRLKVGISNSTLRFSVGLEDIEDVISDIEQALNNSGI